ncbi:MAG: FKBP-type peptidyl-prolyl cis-trans isomerase [Chitinophagaceae bacterium]
MKKLFLLAAGSVFCAALFAQPKTPPKTPVKTPAKAPAKPAPAPQPVLKTEEDSVGYAIGNSIGTSMKNQFLTKVNTNALLRGLNDALKGKPAIMDEGSCQTTMEIYANRMQEENNPTVTAGKVFLDKNKLRPGVKVTPSGLQYEVITEGTGIKPRSIDTFVCHYRGTLADNTEFDNSYTRGEPLMLPANHVIPGWTEGLQLMGVGSKYKFYIPYTLGYGLRGSPPVIPGGATLIFEVELLDVKRNVNY